MIRDRPVGGQPLEKRVAGAGIEEPGRIERPDVRLRDLRRVPEHQLEMGIGGQRGGVVAANRPDVHALVHGLEQPRERVRAGVAFRHRVGGWALVCGHSPAIICAVQPRAARRVRASSPGSEEEEEHARNQQETTDRDDEARHVAQHAVPLIAQRRAPGAASEAAGCSRAPTRSTRTWPLPQTSD